MLTVNWTSIMLPKAQPMHLRDLFLHQDVGVFTGHFSTFVNVDGVCLLRFSKP